MKKIVILQHDGGEMGNQLWNYVSIYAYCLERGYVCENWSFFEYARYFKDTRINSFIRWFFFMPFLAHIKRRSSLRTKIYRLLYKTFVVAPIGFLRSRRVISSRVSSALYYLPPTKKAEGMLLKNEGYRGTTFLSFVSGGVFRNPVGLKKYHVDIVRALAPSPFVEEARDTLVEPLRSRYHSVVGVHLRQGDYAEFKGGKFKITQERVSAILSEYCKHKNYAPDEVCFVITSDGIVDTKTFDGMNIVVSDHSVGEDLFILASCDAVIGSDSTFGNFASYLGDIPHIIMKNEPIDWDYYADKKGYFINKYFTVMLN